MKKIKTYEGFFSNLFKKEEEPQIGDYVICKPTNSYSKDFVDFISNNIGKVIKKGYKISEFESSKDRSPVLYIKYENAPDEIKISIFNYDKKTDSFIMQNGIISDVRCWSSDKEELELEINANKYNL